MFSFGETQSFQLCFELKKLCVQSRAKSSDQHHIFTRGEGGGRGIAHKCGKVCKFVLETCKYLALLGSNPSRFNGLNVSTLVPEDHF
jgi:hypothetical protein